MVAKKIEESRGFVLGLKMERDNTVCWFYPIEKWRDFIKYHFIILMQIQVQLQKVTFFIVKCFLWSRKLKLNCRRLCLTGKKHCITGTYIYKHPHCRFYLLLFLTLIENINFKLGFSFPDDATNAKRISWIVDVWIKTKDKVDFNSIYDFNHKSCWHILGVLISALLDWGDGAKWAGVITKSTFHNIVCTPCKHIWMPQSEV